MNLYFPQGNGLRHSPRPAYETGSVTKCRLRSKEHRRDRNDAGVSASVETLGRDREPFNALSGVESRHAGGNVMIADRGRIGLIRLMRASQTTQAPVARGLSAPFNHAVEILND